jgi:polyisoprenoid-binding protein YceI
VAVATQLRTGRYELVRSSSRARFTVRNFGLRKVSGLVPIVAARVDVYEFGRPSAVRAELDLAGIDTGNDRRDRDLRTPRLLDTVAYPSLIFDGTAEADLTRVSGTIRGRSTAIDVLLAVGAITAGADGHVSLTARTTFDRRALGVRAPRFLIGRRIAVTIDATFRAVDRSDRP